MDKRVKKDQLDEIHEYYLNKHKRTYYGGSGIVRIVIGGTFIAAALFEPSYELVHRAIAFLFGIVPLVYGIRAAIKTNFGDNIEGN